MSSNLLRCVVLAAVLLVFLPGSVLAANFVRIKIYPEHVGVFTSVGKQQFVAFGFRADGSSVNITKLVDWKSSKPNIVSISETGMARIMKGKTWGQVKISCTYPKRKKTPKSKLEGPYLLLLRDIPVEPTLPDPLLGPYLLLLGSDPAPLKVTVPTASASTTSVVPYRLQAEGAKTTSPQGYRLIQRSEYVTLPKN